MRSIPPSVWRSATHLDSHWGRDSSEALPSGLSPCLEAGRIQNANVIEWRLCWTWQAAFLEVPPYSPHHLEECETLRSGQSNRQGPFVVFTPLYIVLLVEIVSQVVKNNLLGHYCYLLLYPCSLRKDIALESFVWLSNWVFECRAFL